jgi:hypothetical protein
MQIGLALGWDCDRADVTVLGAKLTVFFEVDGAAVRQRFELGLHACVDPFTLRQLLACQPEVWDPSPVRLRAGLAERRTWSAAAEAVSVFAAFGQQAVALPGPAARTQRVWLEAAASGIGVVAVDSDEVRVIASTIEREAASRTWIHRLAEEQVFAAYEARITR